MATARRSKGSASPIAVEPRDLRGVVMEARAHSTTVRLSREHEKHNWVSIKDFADVDFATQFIRLVQHYAQDVAINPRVPKAAGASAPPDIFSVARPESLKKHLLRFQRNEDRFQSFSDFLHEFLASEAKAIVPVAETSARAKDVVSFAKKLMTKDKYTNPFVQITDFAGARVVVHLTSEVEAVCTWIESTFRVDWVSLHPRAMEFVTYSGWTTGQHSL